MNRFLQIFNLIGVMVLIALCTVQWMANRASQLNVLVLRQKAIEQAAKITEQDKTIAGNIADLESFRSRLVKAEDAQKETQAKLAQTQSERDTLAADAEKLKQNLKQWMAATAARDESIKQQETQIQTLSDARNDAINKFNNLATKYNDTVNKLNTAADQIQKLATERDNAITKFNTLADQYNTLINKKK